MPWIDHAHSQLTQRINALPAGGQSVLLIVIIILLLLVIL